MNEVTAINRLEPRDELILVIVATFAPLFGLAAMFY